MWMIRSSSMAILKFEVRSQSALVTSNSLYSGSFDLRSLGKIDTTLQIESSFRRSTASFLISL